MAVLVAATVGHAQAPAAVVSPVEARNRLGAECTVEGAVTATTRDGNTVRLTLGAPPDDVSVALVIGLFSGFPPQPERYYAARTVRVTGTVRRFRDTVELTVRDPARIEVVGAAAATAGGGAAVPAGDAPAGDDPRWRDVLDRLRRLEDRLDRLEQAAPTRGR